VLEAAETPPFYRRAQEAGIHLTEGEMKALEEPYEAHPVLGH